MNVAITGGSGRIGRAIVAQALGAGHDVVSIDRTAPLAVEEHPNLSVVLADIADYEALVSSMEGCDALIHMAAIPAPIGYPDHVVHNNNVVGSYNALRAAVENGIMRICQASSVNAIGHAYSRQPRYDYFPIDELHPNYAEDPYSLSKWICEQQADSFARRHDGISIASLRFHWVLPSRADAKRGYEENPDWEFRKNLYAYTGRGAAATACLQAVSANLHGHEVFYICAPDTAVEVPSLELAAKHLPDVPIRGDLGGVRSFFDSSKAARLLGWSHPEHPRPE